MKIASPPADLGTLFARAVRLIAETAAVDVYEVDLILLNISCNPAFQPLWAWAPAGIKALILQSILASGLSRATSRQLR